LQDHRQLDGKGRLIGYRNLDAVREKLTPILLRRTRAEVLGQLPERTDSIIFVELTDAQRTPYEEQRTALARLLQKKVLTDLDRKRILSCIANLRMLCASTWLYDRTTNVSPKLDEFGELIPELSAAGGHKVVVFSQWEMLLQKAVEVLARLAVGHEFLHGRVPGKDRRRLLQRFRDDPDCRVLLSTDAGNSGLNLQVADTVVNLDVPWNPAVLEQRIARVHRMGQNRPVRVINFVTRNSIEERVLRTIEQKRGLFASVFDGDSDEVRFDVQGDGSFLNVVRELLGEESPRDVEPNEASKTIPVAAIELLEALATDRNWSLSPDLRDRAAAALRAMLDRIAPSFGSIEGSP
jgi:SNF2 family DNA or RNA helicase